MKNSIGKALRFSTIFKNNSFDTIFHPLRRFADEKVAEVPKKVKRKRKEVPENLKVGMKAIAKHYLGKETKQQNLYVMNEEAAIKFGGWIAENLAKNVSCTVELNSGLGLLTKELLKAGIPSIRLFEGVSYFWPLLENIKNEYPERLHLERTDFTPLWSIGYFDWKQNTDKLQRYFESVEKRSWEEDPTIQIIGATMNMNFFNQLISIVVFRNSFAKYGRMTLRMAISPSIWIFLTCNNEAYGLYRSRTVLFQTLFDYELLGTLPRSAFYPNYRRLKQKKQRGDRVVIKKIDEKFINVVKIEPKANLSQEGFSENDIVPFYYFVRHHLKSRSNRIIPELETWVPGCGKKLISHGFNIYTEFGELSPQEILKLFILFKSWPEYKKSTFISCLDTFMLKIDEHVDSDNLEERFEFSLDQSLEE